MEADPIRPDSRDAEIASLKARIVKLEAIIGQLTRGNKRQAAPGYSVMGVAKAALESSARYLALELGSQKIRVNTMSAGPVRTLSAMAVGGIDEMFAHQERKSPLRRNIDGDEVGKTAVYLLSDLSSGVTGENIFVDAGFNIVGLQAARYAGQLPGVCRWPLVLNPVGRSDHLGLRRPRNRRPERTRLTRRAD